MMGMGTAARGRYACGCRVGVSRLGEGVVLPLPICSRHGSGYGMTTVAVRWARAALRRMGGALRVRR